MKKTFTTIGILAALGLAGYLIYKAKFSKTDTLTEDELLGEDPLPIQKPNLPFVPKKLTNNMMPMPIVNQATSAPTNTIQTTNTIFGTTITQPTSLITQSQELRRCEAQAMALLSPMREAYLANCYKK
jgi:hypothetical protein